MVFIFPHKTYGSEPYTLKFYKWSLKIKNAIASPIVKNDELHLVAIAI
jgi:hypothetical protein